ncbi:MAG: CPBP family intramembrane glutamic endopeptidase [Candidatus Aminicenantales bacterium]
MPFSGWTVRFLPVLAAALFGPLLAFRRLGPLDFWWAMSASLAVLVVLGLLSDVPYRDLLRQDLRRGILNKIILGLTSALVLYLVFWAGGTISRAHLPFATEGIDAVYAFKRDASVVRLILLIILVIGPGEEIFWRGFIQRRWEDRLGFPAGWLLASAFYALVHVGSRNIMLVLAALVCGLFWGALYSRSRSVLLVALSHAAWDLVVFIIFPLR